MKILIAAGGTGGHIYPGLAIADKIKKEQPQADIIFIGSLVGMEKNIIPGHGYHIDYIRVRGFEKSLSLETLAAVKGLFDGMRDARRIIKKHQPDLVIGTGGFTAGPLLLQAKREKIPTFIHEQNAFPGKTNRILGKKVDRVAISFQEAQAYFPKDKTCLCGNPVGEQYFLTDRQFLRQGLKLSASDKMILIMGGSQGAASINESALELMGRFQDNPNVSIVHLTGRSQYDKIKNQAKEKGLTKNPNIMFFAYHQHLYELLGAADLVVARSGAMSVAEIAAIGVPSILIPYPKAAGNHQEFNARVITDGGGGILILDSQLNGDLLSKEVEALLDDEKRLQEMSRMTKKMGIPNASERIYDQLVKLMEST